MDVSLVLTGVTGFLGKVVLEELVRTQDELNITQLRVLVRPKASKTAQQRFCDEIANSLCFSRLDMTWKEMVQIVECDLSQPSCGIQSATYMEICKQTTHIIHCAGTVAFSSDIQKMVSGNIISALNVLELARECENLHRLVSTSTAFVSPPTSDPIHELLVPLPMAAQGIYQMLQDETIDSGEILNITGHPNLYTLSKSLAEYLMIEKRDDVPLVIMRPSIISASVRYPFPGWIDSFAALAGLVASAGTGILRVLKADAEVIMDVVPVDDVARRLIEETMLPKKDTDGVKIAHVVSTIKDGMEIETTCSIVLDYFKGHRVLFKPRVRLVKNKRRLDFHFYDILEHRLPLAIAKVVAAICGDTKELRRIERGRKVQVQANDLFRVFTHNTYDFRCRHRSLSQDFRSDAYTLQVCQGVREYLLLQRHM